MRDEIDAEADPNVGSKVDAKADAKFDADAVSNAEMTTDDLASLLVPLRQLVAERGWSAFHDPKNLAMLIASEAGELLAEYRWVENGKADAHSQEPEARARIAAELGDVGIGLLLLCDRIGLDVREVIRNKMADVARKYPADESRGRPDRKR